MEMQEKRVNRNITITGTTTKRIFITNYQGPLS